MQSKTINHPEMNAKIIMEHINDNFIRVKIIGEFGYEIDSDLYSILILKELCKYINEIGKEKK